MSSVSAIVVAAGKGLRLKSKTAKPLINIDGKPAIIYALRVLNKEPRVKEIIIAANPDNIQGIRKVVKKYRINKAKKIILGGARRQDSVFNGLKVAEGDMVLIHDAGRPFIDSKIVRFSIAQAQKSGAAIVGVPVKATIKAVGSSQALVVRATLDRSRLWEIQTPQVFNKDLLLEAYRKFGNEKVTDDASLVEKLGKKVKIVLGSYNNIKITTPEDLVLAQAIAKNLR
ncbi:MAG: 2-C-methyl-D-erythritol 4-phosphate cytidylyltransferase [Candidatus Omnitrophota bacterium]